MADSAIAKAYVQILPTTQGIGSQLSAEMSKAGENAGNVGGERAGSKFGAAFKIAALAAVAAVGKIIGDSINFGAELEQNLGGAQAVFGNFARSIEVEATDAYRNMGLSASDYMATANKMGSLLQGSGINITASFNMTRDAMQRAADVASVMGISTSDAMEAIAGAAKGNFTMMDNLGVAMNATTLQAYALEKGINFKWDTASNAEKTQLAMQMFFEKTQKYAGNFARESDETLSGSLASMKASFQNVLADLATGRDINASLGALLSSATTFLMDNLLPTLETIFETLPGALVTVLTKKLPLIVPTVVDLIMTIVPALVEGLVQLIQILAEQLPHMLKAFFVMLPSIIEMLVSTLIENLPLLIQGVVDLVLGIVDALPDIINSLIEALPQIIELVVTALIETFPLLLGAAIQIIAKLALKMPEIIKGLFTALWTSVRLIVEKLIEHAKEFPRAAKEWISSLWEQMKTSLGELPQKALAKIQELVSAITQKVSDFVNIGKNLVTGLWNGIKSGWTWLTNKVKELANSLLAGVKKVLGIASPSKEFAEVGAYITEGLALGIGSSDAVNHVKSEMGDVLDDITGMTYDGVTAAVSVSGMGGDSIYTQLAGAVSSISQKLDRLQIVMDSGALVGAISEKMDGKLGAMSNLTARGATV